MATTEEYKNGGSASYTFSIDKIKDQDIKVAIDGGTPLTYTTSNPPANTNEYTVSGTNVIFKQASVSGSSTNGVRIYRETALEDADSATFVAGSSIRAADLNNNHRLLRFSAQEKNQQTTTADIRDGQITSAKILDGTIVDADINASANIQGSKLANDSVSLDKLGSGTLPSDIQVDSNNIGSGGFDDRYYTETELDSGQLDNRYYTETELTSGGVLDSKYYTETELDAGQLDNRYYTETELNAGQLDTRYFTETELTSGGSLDTRYYTKTELDGGALNTNYLTTASADARYFNISSGDTIKDGDAFPDNDTTIATTAAINDRIIDLVDDVGGFVPIANETSFPTANPDANNGTGTIVSVKAASTTLTPSGTTVTITNGAGTGNTVTITGVTDPIPQNLGFLVETTTTLHTYTFHRLVPDATQVSTVASNITLLNAVNNNSGNIIATGTDINNVNTVAGSISNVNTVGLSIGDVNAVANALGASQTFTVTVSGGVFYINGKANPSLTLTRGFTYTFDQADSTNSGHPLAFRDSNNTIYTSGVTVNGTAGQSGSTVVFAVPSTAPSSLIYYCTQHGNSMGNSISVINDNIGIVAGNISDINSVAGNETNINAAVTNQSNINSAVSNETNINSAVSNETNINAVAGSITNVNNVGNSITNVNTVASNLGTVNDFAARYSSGASNPTTNLDTGDLFFNTTANELKVYNGSSWQGGVTAQNQLYTDNSVDTHLNQSNPTAGHVLSWNGSDYAWVDNAGFTNADVDSHLNQSNPTSGYVLSWNGSDYAWVDNAGYTDTNVNTHLNQSTANSSQVLSWNGTDYAWVDQSSGGLVGGGNEQLFVEAENEVNNNFTTTTNKNYVSASPLTVASTATITIVAGSTMTFV